ncbi:MAG TPA: hypothetical protein VGH14_18100 [Solirubrobacterales bacterium]|jgi:hypothetical protein
MSAHDEIGLPRAAARLTLIALLVAAFFAISHADANAATSCFSKPSACGYPDATTAGVPAGTALTTVSSVTLSSGQTLEGKVVTNGVLVTGPNVTIRNSVIKTPSGGNGSAAIELTNGATNFTIEHSEVTGNGSKTNAPESNVWNHYNDAGFKVIGSYLHGVPDNIEGSVAEVRDSFIAVDAEYSGAHSENIYLCGASANVQHSTLYNESDETSLIFGDGICGKGNTVTVENSLLAGGGYMLQPNAKGVSAPVKIIGNRVGRCLTTAHQDSGGGYVCSSGKDANGFWPRGGHYGLDTELGSAATWTGNVWDDNSQPMCPNEKAGCGVVTPPTEVPTEPTPPTEPPVEEPTQGEPIEEPVVEPPTEEPAKEVETPTEEPPTAEPPTEEKPVEVETPTEPTGGGHHGRHHGGGGTKPTGPSQSTEESEASPTAPTPPTGTEVTPPNSPLPLPGNVVGDVTAALEGILGNGGARGVTAIWHASKAWVNGPVVLDGTDSTAPGHRTCIWTVEDPSGSTVTAKNAGCRVRYHFRHAGIGHVTLTVRGADGTAAQLRKEIVVRGDRQSGQPRVARAARAF